MFTVNELELMFSQLEVEQISDLTESIGAAPDEALSEKIRKKAGVKSKANIIRPDFFRLIAAAACLVLVFCSGVFLSKNSLIPAEQPTETTSPLQTDSSSQSYELSLVKAIVSGNDGLIMSLIENAAALSSEIMSIAVEYSEYLSYESLQSIGLAVYEKLGSTGLDSLLECTLLGNSQKALEELEKRENLLMTPTEKLSFFFSVAFCDSKVVEYFLTHGYGTELTDEKGESTFEIARNYNNSETLNLLENYEKTA